MRIHALLYSKNEVLATLNLSKKFDINFDGETKVIQISDAIESNSLAIEGVTSSHTLFGENGSGKSELLLGICETFTESESAQFGVLFEDEYENLRIYLGEPLDDWQLNPNEVGLKISRSQRPDCDCIFYTTSPFESTRRRNLRSVRDCDVSPKFGTASAVNSFGLLRNPENIPEDIRENGKALIRALLPTPLKIGQQFFRYESAFPVSEIKQRERLKNAFVHLLESLNYESRTYVQIWAAQISRFSSQFQISKYVSDWLLQWYAVVTPRVNPESVESELPEVSTAKEKFLNGLFKDFNSYLPNHDQIVSSIFRTFFSPKGILYDRNSRALTLETLIRVDKLNDSFDSVTRHALDIGAISFGFRGLSSGQAAYLYLITAITGALRKRSEFDTRRPIFLCLDEGEMFMHPKWQREYIENIFEVVRQFQFDREIHLLFATHSLIVAADSPPNSLFDVQNMRYVNGFALGPTPVLENVYNVEQFYGHHATKLISMLVKYLEGSREIGLERAESIASLIADEALKAEVIRDLARSKANND